MAIDFPNSPVTNDTYVVGDRKWVYDGEKWALVSASPELLVVSATAPTNTNVIWADTSVTGVGVVPVGGTTNQVLAKSSSADYDAVWKTPQYFVCTSSTRPSSPITGQSIYETDTDKVLLWNGSAWMPPTGVLPNIVEFTTTSYTAHSSTSYTATPLSVTITKSHTNSAIWVVASPQLAVYTGGTGTTDMYLSARLIETVSSRERDFLYVLRSYNANNDARVNSTKACLQWMDTATGTGSRTYRLDTKVHNGAHTGEFNMYTTGICLSEITALEVVQ
jgi:hypothetical protein